MAPLPPSAWPWCGGGRESSLEMGAGCNWGCQEQGWASAGGAAPNSGKNSITLPHWVLPLFTLCKETFQAEYNRFKSTVQLFIG